VSNPGVTQGGTHLLPQEFFLNSRGGIVNPMGLIGSQLDISLHVMTCDNSLHQSPINAVNKTRIEVKRVVLQSIASRAAVLSPEENVCPCHRAGGSGSAEEYAPGFSEQTASPFIERQDPVVFRKVGKRNVRSIRAIPNRQPLPHI
jgi:hypothetical protein